MRVPTGGGLATSKIAMQLGCMPVGTAHGGCSALHVLCAVTIAADSAAWQAAAAGGRTLAWYRCSRGWWQRAREPDAGQLHLCICT
jgi:hypothetical protein